MSPGGYMDNFDNEGQNQDQSDKYDRVDQIINEPDDVSYADDDLYDDNYDGEEGIDPQGGGAGRNPYGGYDGEEFGEVSQPSYDSQSAQLTNDIAADESQPVTLHFIKDAHMGNSAKKRMIMRLSAFLSKNQVFSNIENTRDFQMVQDDFEYAKILSRTDFTSYDITSDYLSAEAVLEAQHNIRLRRSRRALYLKQLNTSIQRSENVDMTETEENKKLNRKFSFLGNSG